MRSRLLVASALLAVPMSACFPQLDTAGIDCFGNDGCQSGQVCMRGKCVSKTADATVLDAHAPDAPPPHPDSGMAADTGTPDLGTGMDAMTPDNGMGTDGPIDASMDAATSTAADASMDASMDATTSTAADAAADAGPMDTGVPPDTGVVPDSGVTPADTGVVPDSGVVLPDTGVIPDSGVVPPDTGVVPDAGLIDTGPPDTGVVDTGTPDTGIMDSAAPDAIVDSGPADTGPADTGTLPLTVDFSGAGSGSVAISPDGGTCTSVCTTQLPIGSTATLQAQAAVSSQFSGWSGACSGTNPSCMVTMSMPQSVTAGFDLFRTLTVSVSGPATGTGQVNSSTGGIMCTSAGGAQCSASLPDGTMLTLTAVPGGLATFGSWGGACSGILTPTCMLTMSADRAVTATFLP